MSLWVHVRLEVLGSIGCDVVCTRIDELVLLITAHLTKDSLDIGVHCQLLDVFFK